MLPRIFDALQTEFEVVWEEGDLDTIWLGLDGEDVLIYQEGSEIVLDLVDRGVPCVKFPMGGGDSIISEVVDEVRQLADG